MPFTRITLRQGYSDAQITQISDILQRTLEDEFTVPAGDRFQVFETLPARQRVFDQHYKSGGRSDNFIQFHILAGKPRTREQKQNLCRVLCQRLQSALDIHPNDVMVMIQFNTVDEWSFSQGRLQSEEA
ncbi:MAG: tautomerase family protein [Enterobacteriaceae bacterium]|uniref:Tautomerase family protein n=1 Tax=Phytobacter palmae TaxID=1855371 RepID=A0ABU9V1B5_9ENTR|nr:tautomerase family protein [Enterobacteriaceae bacterium]SFF08603.1 Tautomerase enzyme [Phytobacter palmae]